MKKEIDEKVENLENDVKKLNKRIFPPKEAEIRGDPVVRLKD